MSGAKAVVVGAGPAGMMAALTAAEQGHQVTILERQARVGRKLMATGNGRCNLTNRHASPAHYHGQDADFCASPAHYHGQDADFCAYALEEYGPLALAVMEQWGVTESSHVGDLVYNLIEVGVFGKQEGDRREQFDGLTPVAMLLNAPYETIQTA